MQGPLRNELLILFGAEEQRGEIRHVMELLGRRGRVESQLDVLRCLNTLIADGLVEAPRGALTDARIYQATPASLHELRAFRERRMTEEAEDESRKTTPITTTDPGDLGGYEEVELSAPEVSLMDDPFAEEALLESAEPRSLRQLALEVLSAQETEGLCVVAQAFARAMRDLQKVATGRRGVTPALALRVARLVGVGMDELLAGQWLSARVCPHCGHPPDDFIDEETVVE